MIGGMNASISILHPSTQLIDFRATDRLYALNLLHETFAYKPADHLNGFQRDDSVPRLDVIHGELAFLSDWIDKVILGEINVKAAPNIIV